jgi:hypothetical protein
MTVLPAREKLIHLSAIDVGIIAGRARGLVMGASAIPTSEPGRWYQEPIFCGGVMAVVFVVLNIALW